MGVSTEKKLEGKEDEVLRDVQLLGWSKTMYKHDIRSLEAFNKWYRLRMGKDCYSIKATSNYSLGLDGNKLPLIDWVAQRLNDRFSNLNKEIERLRSENKKKDEIIATLLANDYERNAGQLLKLLEACQA